MLLKLILISIIIYIIIEHLVNDELVYNEDYSENNEPRKYGLGSKSKTHKIRNKNRDFNGHKERPFNLSTPKFFNRIDSVKDTAMDFPSYPDSTSIIYERPVILKSADYNEIDENTNIQTWSFEKPTPWSEISYDASSEYPYSFFIKLKVPSLNDLQVWKQIIPNIGFNPKSGRLSIPSKDEASALALANLIATHFRGDLEIKDIIEKNLIQISISKAKAYEVVQTKLREQIVESLYGSSKSSLKDTDYEKDFAQNKKQPMKKETNDPETMNLKSSDFRDTFEHFTSPDVDAYDGNDFSYL